MHTYYARHTSKLDIDENTRERLWAEDLIAVHYPERRNDELDLPDNASLAVEDYPQTGKSRSVIRTLSELSAAGGYVCAEYFPDDRIKIGIVASGTHVQMLHGQWGSCQRVAILKTLKMANVRALMPLETMVVLASRPRQGTLQHWYACGNRIRDMVDGRTSPLQVDDLVPYEQEVMCAEFLRLELAAARGLPRLSSLLAPVGRSMKDIDIIGVTIDGRKVVAQVTWYGDEDQKSKIAALRKYVQVEQATGVFFCNCNEMRVDEGVVFFPLKDVFQEFSRSEVGTKWVSLIRGN